MISPVFLKGGRVIIRVIEAQCFNIGQNSATPEASGPGTCFVPDCITESAECVVSPSL